MKFLFDLGGVFFDWDPHYFYKDVIKNKEEETIFSIIFAMMNGISNKMLEDL